MWKYKEYLWVWRLGGYAIWRGGYAIRGFEWLKEMLSSKRNVICGLNIVFELYGHIIPTDELYDM